ncbi:MAG: DUF2871 family protein [Cellulosilyticaceae bacterium]
MKKYLWMSTIYLVLALILGVFYREFTKLSGFEGQTTLSTTHTHLLVLGFIMGLVFLILDKQFDISKAKAYKIWFGLYNVSVTYMITTMIIRGVVQVKGLDIAYLNHIAGLGHAMLGISLIWFMTILFRMIGKETQA